MTGQLNTLELKQKQYNTAIATIEEHALNYSFLAFSDFKLKQSRFFKTGHTVPALVEMRVHQYKQPMPHSFQAMHTIKTFRQYKTTTGRIENKSRGKEKKKKKKVPSYMEAVIGNSGISHSF